MITTLTVAIDLDHNRPVPVPGFGGLSDPRLLLGVQRTLMDRPGVLWADLASRNRGYPVFVVALNNVGPDGSRASLDHLVAGLLAPISLRLVFAADGGVKETVVPLEVVVQ